MTSRISLLLFGPRSFRVEFSTTLLVSLKSRRDFIIETKTSTSLFAQPLVFVLHTRVQRLNIVFNLSVWTTETMYFQSLD